MPFLQEGKRPFTEVLSATGILQALGAIEIHWSDRIFSPLVTLWFFWDKYSVQISLVVRKWGVWMLIVFRRD